MSTLGRLFAFALPGSLAELDRRLAAENFTTEALAGAIRGNPAPISLALKRAGVAIPAYEPTATVTQVVYNSSLGMVIPDLIVAWEEADALEVWIEVKVGAPLSGGDQLDRYRRTINELTAGDGLPRELVLLAPTDLRPAIEQSNDGRRLRPEWLPWQGIIDAIDAEPHADAMWSDLAAFLEEQGMTQGTNFPITAREIASLQDAHALFEKGYALIANTNRTIREMGIGVPEYWWPDGQVRRAVATQFERKGRVMIFGASMYPAPFFYGLAPDVRGEALVTVWIEVDPRNTSARTRLLSWFNDRAALLPMWRVNREDRYFRGWPVLVAVESPVNLPTQEAARDWIVSRIRELTNAGYFELVVTLGAQPAPEPESGGLIDDAAEA